MSAPFKMKDATFDNAPTSITPPLTDRSTKLVTSEFVGDLTTLSIRKYGGNNDGVTDNTAALNAALSAAEQYVGRVIICFPPGKYVFNSTITYTFPNVGASISIVGSGLDVTELCWPSSSIGLRINYLGAFNSVQIRDLSFTCGTANTATALFLHQNSTSIPNPALSSLSSITNVAFRGSDGYGVNNVWAFGVDAFAVSNINFTNCNFVGSSTATQGTGVILHGLNASCQGVAANFVGCFFTILNIGIGYLEWYQGVTVNQCNFTGGQIGIQAPLGAGGQDQLIVSNCQINCAQAAMQLNEPFPGLMVMNNFIILQAANSRGITGSNYGNFQIVGNQFGAAAVLSGTVGIYWNAAQGGILAGGTIAANTFFALENAVQLDVSSTRVNVQSNLYSGCTNNVTNVGTGNTIGGGSQ
jgi:hypothetical protein